MSGHLKSIIVLLLSAGFVLSQSKIPLIGVSGRKDLVKTNAVISFRHLTNLTDSGNAAEYRTAAFTPSANALAIAAVVTSDTVPPDSHVLSSLHGSWYKVVETPFNTTASALNNLSVWYCNASATSSALTNKFAGAATGCAMICWEFRGIDLTDSSGISAVRQNSVLSIDATGNPTISLNSAMQTHSRNCAVAICASGDSNPVSITNEVNWVTIGDVGYNTPSTGIFATYRLATTDNGITMSNNAATDRAAIMLEIRVEP